MKKKLSRCLRKKNKKSRKKNMRGGEQVFKKGQVYVYQNMYVSPKSDGQTVSRVVPICTKSMEPATQAHKEKFESSEINIEDAIMETDTDILKEVYNLYKATKDAPKELPVSRRLTPEEIRHFKQSLYTDYDKVELPVTPEELSFKQELEINQKKIDIYNLMSKSLENSQYMSNLCSKLDMVYTQLIYDWLIKNSMLVLTEYIKNYPMILTKKNEQGITKDIIKLCLSKYKEEQQNIQRVMKLESLNLDKQYLHNFGLKYNYRLIPQEQILSRCVQLGHIGHLVMKEMMTNHHFNYLRIGVHHQQQNILYHCLLELICSQYYTQIDVSILNRLVSALRHRIVFNYLNGEDFEIYFQPRHKDDKNYTRDPDMRYKKLQNYVQSMSDNNDWDFPLLSSVLNYNIFIITSDEIPLNYKRFCFKNSRENLVIFKTVKNDQNYYEPIIQLLPERINLSHLTYEQLRRKNTTLGIFNSNHDLILTLISKYILKYSEDTEKYSDCFQNFEISSSYFEHLISGRYLPESITSILSKSSLCGRSTIFPREKFSSPQNVGRSYHCNSEHPLLFKIDNGLGGFEDLCCTDDLSAHGVGEFITRYNQQTRTFDRVKVPLNKYTTFINEFKYSNKRIMEQVINPEQLITHYDLKILLPVFDEYTFNNRFQIRKFVETNKDFSNNLEIIYKMGTLDVLIDIVGDKNNSILREHFEKFEKSWRTFKDENQDFYNESTDTVERFIKLYSTIFDNKRKQETKEEKEKQAKEEKEKQAKEENEKQAKEEEEKNKDEDSDEFSFKVNIGGTQYEMVRNSVKDNKFAFYNPSKICLSFFIGGQSLEKGKYVVLNVSGETYSKLTETPGSDIYTLLLRKLKDSSEPSDLYKNAYKFITDTYQKFQNKEPNEIEESLLEEINNLG